jgi:hypothetical protein
MARRERDILEHAVTRLGPTSSSADYRSAWTRSAPLPAPNSSTS